MNTTCTAIPVASVLASAGRDASPLSGSANAILAVHLLPPAPRDTPSCTSDAAAVKAALRHTNAHDGAAGAPEGFSTLQLLVAAPLEDGAAPRLHIGAGSSLLLVVPKSRSNSSEGSGSGGDQSDAALQQVAAEAAVQALGRWVLSPLKDGAAVSADLRIRLWLLGDTGEVRGEEGDIDLNGQTKEGVGFSGGVEDIVGVAGAAVGGPSSRALGTSAPPQLSWDGWALLRIHLRGFLEAISSLLDLQITSQVVPDSGLGEVEWDLLRRGEELRGKAEKAFQEETVRRLLVLQEQWGSDPDYSPSASVVNLTLYRPSSRTEAWAPGSAVALPSWGFLTFGVPSPGSGFRNRASDFSSQRLEEEAAVRGAWIAQLRSVLGLQPTPELQEDDLAELSCRPPADSTLCGEHCRAQRCAWRVAVADLTDPTGYTGVAQKGDTSDLLFGDAGFALAPIRAVLVARRDSFDKRVGVYVHPSSRGLTEWELGGLAADAHFKMITEAAKNIQTLHSVLVEGTDVRVTKYVAQAMHGVLNQIQCSLQALRMQRCPTLPTAAREFLLRVDADICPMKDSDGVPLLGALGPPAGRADGCGGFSRSSPSGKTAVYRQLALLLARAAMKDAKALLTDGSLEPAPFFSLHFNLAVHVPLLLPFVLPTVVSLSRAAKSALRK
ncbi:uncharacterized protein EMH_0028140 [Eimeria mitis]|uniref:Uncharacterized protein n=1 Tax=Eimeria mitis TaxID=44415 RepID=U6KJL6_9EIME|nr:uncharacterized protein EMH_0028140 [Eimeria mitis]CDJ35648.1 hypothetical protein, conserved [Eimeria mitis]